MKIRDTLKLTLLIACTICIHSCESGFADVETGDITAIHATTADIAGQILSVGDGIKRYGHCYSRTNDPTISDEHTVFSVAIGTGTYLSHIINLEPGTMYYARAYATSGNITVYGREVSFTTTESGR